jgi:hypothetical protein
MTVNVIAPQRSKLSREALTEAFVQTAELIDKRRCSEIGEGYIEGYVALNWMEWNGGSLRLTETGQNIRKRLRG